MPTVVIRRHAKGNSNKRLVKSHKEKLYKHLLVSQIGDTPRLNNIKPLNRCTLINS